MSNVDKDKQSVEATPSGLQTRSGLDLVDQEFFHRPHSEFLEQAFSGLYQAWEDGDLEEYRRRETDFIQKFGQYWGFRIRRYQEALAEKGSDTFNNGTRFWVDMGTDLEETEIRQRPFTEGRIDLHIFSSRNLGVAEYDVLDIEDYLTRIYTPHGISLTSYAKVSLQTTVENRQHPLPCNFYIEFSGNNIMSFKRTTTRSYTDTDGVDREITRTESMGYSSHR